MPLFEGIDPPLPTAVTIFKDSEPCFAGTRVQPNYVTFHGFIGDDGAQLHTQPDPEPAHKIEFLGDSITAGFDNCCDVADYHKPDGHLSSSSSFERSWATEICQSLDGECHYTAWSGFGMVRNCCGGATLGSDVWGRTLATVGSANASDPHGTTSENAWNFSAWTADAVVINLGTKYSSLATVLLRLCCHCTHFHNMFGSCNTDCCQLLLQLCPHYTHLLSMLGC